MASLGLFSVLVAGEVYVSPHGSDRNAGTKEAPYLTLNRAIMQAREWRRLNRPEAAGGICICVGWGWTSLESGMKNNRIEANYVHHFARRLYDAGGLYTLSNQPGSVMRNNRIEHLEEAPYATNDRAFYIYLDEATDGYTIENNWCPTERFDSNRPGNRNVWKNNGPQVTESIKNKAGRIKPE